MPYGFCGQNIFDIHGKRSQRSYLEKSSGYPTSTDSLKNYRISIFYRKVTKDYSQLEMTFDSPK